VTDLKTFAVHGELAPAAPAARLAAAGAGGGCGRLQAAA
jgi:hypothetical protein